MSNTEKKLDALIDALGFDVEEVAAFDHFRYSFESISNPKAKKGDFIFPHYKFTKRYRPAINKPKPDIWKVDTCIGHSLNDKDEDLIDGQVYKFNYKSKNTKYDNCIMTYRKSIRKFACFKYLLDLEFCTDIKRIIVDE